MKTAVQAPLIKAEPFISFPEKTDDRIQRILFVCTGNTCRSPMAAAWLNHYGAAHGIEASSAGLFPIPGAPISANALEALRSAGIVPTPDNRFDLHTARPLEESLFRKYDRVIGMTHRHAMEMIYSFPSFAEKISSMSKDIPDPFGGSADDYRECLDAVAAELKEMFLLDV